MRFSAVSRQSPVHSQRSLANRRLSALGCLPSAFRHRPSAIRQSSFFIGHSPLVILHLSFSLLLAACASPSAPAQPTDTPVVAFGGAAAPNGTPSAPDYLQVALPTINPNDPLRFTFPTPQDYPTPLNWRPPVEAVPISLRPEDHFWFARPIASNSVNYPLWAYRYGSTNFGAAHIHAGIDVDAPLHTPVLAAGPGEVVWAGWGLFNFRPGLVGDPYGIAVEIKHDFGYQNEMLYTLYGHMEALNYIYVGQRVETGDVLGWVGVTGNTTGPHVHFEVRQGLNDYFHTRNPELWIAPYSGWGVLAGQLLDEAGYPIYEAPIDIYNAQGRYVSQIYTYGDRVANGDDEWRENFAISDLPEGTYLLRAQLGRAVAITATPGTPQKFTSEIVAQVNVQAGQTNFVVLQAGRGVVGSYPAASQTPPYPTNTPTNTATPTETATPTPSRTPRPSATPRPSRTPTATRTPRFSPTPAPSPFSNTTP